jgi:diguanylate cyclase (GGDEF)-like protein
MAAKILVVDDSQHMREFFADSVLRPAGYTVLTAPDGRAGLKMAQAHRPDLIVADLQMPGLSGLELKRALGEAGDTTPMILVTAEGSEKIASQATLAGIAYYLPKPVDVDVMLTAINRALAVERLRRERAEALRALEQRVHQLETLQGIGRALTESRDISQVMVIVLEAAVRLTGADGGALFLLDGRTAQLALRAVQGKRDGAVRAVNEPAADTVAAQVVRNNQPLIGRSNSTQRGTTGSLSYPVLYVPLRVREHMVGALAVDSRRQARDFTANDVGPLSTLADYAAVAINNAQLFEELNIQSNTDGLTGLFNRRHFFTLAEREFQRARRFSRSLSVIMLDIDHFKRVNDTYGHAAGDQVLIEIAHRMRASIRNIDVLGRYGGEEFAMVLPETELPGAGLLAERLRKTIAATVVNTVGGPVTVTVSMGVAPFAPEVADFTALIHNADLALYAAKQAGRNQVLPYPPPTRPQSEVRPI